MVTAVGSKMMSQHGSPSAAQDAHVVRSFQKLLEDEEAEEVFREFILPAQPRQTRLPQFRWEPTSLRKCLVFGGQAAALAGEEG
jgi:hypothetical protein